MTTPPTPRDRPARIPPAVARGRSSAIAVGFGLLFATSAAAQQEWRHHGGDPGETRYSPLDQVDAGNVAGLGVAWSREIPKTGARIEATPLIADGVLYSTGPFSVVFRARCHRGRRNLALGPRHSDRGPRRPAHLLRRRQPGRGAARRQGHRRAAGRSAGRAQPRGRVAGVVDADDPSRIRL